MKSDNAVIIGASTAGLYTAYLLARAGIPVELYDVDDSLGEPPRTLIVTSTLTEVLGFRPEAAILNQVDRIVLSSAGSETSVILDRPDLVIERRKLVELLALKAREEGAEILPGFEFVGFEGDTDRLVVHLRQPSTDQLHLVAANVLIGADGALSRVAKAASRDSRATVALAQAKVMLRDTSSARCVKVWFDRQRTPYFYWLIPESDTRAVIGVIAEDGGSVKESLQEFLAAQGYEALDFQAGRVALHEPSLEPWRQVANSRVLLVGDAGGHVKTTTVGGVVAGLRGARAAARAVIGSTPYRRALQPLKRELDLQFMIRTILNRFTDRDYDRLLELMHSGSRGVLRAHNRDQFKSAFFRLLRAEPRLLLLAARALLRLGNDR